ncbi:hypothetical protein [Paraferrimonas sedimenticola]|uniref:Outer membrane protein beta-barrel domain-containing protein n=1 Tax=Paraferrimonas sedimenticola TaxID=375674 RepID=A0AA37RXB6_9GAMM|nr:hypothetical protein [Paraferrimonas sedimenticola]GLP97099.1 hypothetical protein GCM10007895_24050 [Paraferrimonas sedimenticola]
MRKIAVLLFALTSSSVYADEWTFETGIGVDYGFAGIQMGYNLPVKSLEAFLAIGLNQSFARDSGQVISGGAGGKLWVNKYMALVAYGGVVKLESTGGYTPPGEPSSSEYKATPGASLGVKFYFSGRRESGWTLGANYNQYKGGSYPFISVGYRY